MRPGGIIANSKWHSHLLEALLVMGYDQLLVFRLRPDCQNSLIQSELVGETTAAKWQRPARQNDRGDATPTRRTDVMERALKIWSQSAFLTRTALPHNEKQSSRLEVSETRDTYALPVSAKMKLCKACKDS